jgi:hypothetical protein
MSDGYLRRQRNYSTRSGSMLISTMVPVVLVTCRSVLYSLFLQRVQLYVASPGFEGSYWKLIDSCNVPISGQLQTDHAPASAGFPYTYSLDFGPEGLALSPGANLVLDGTISDAHGSIVWDAYCKLTTSPVNLTTLQE